MIKAVIFDCFGVIITDGLELVVQKLEKTDSHARQYISDIIRANNLGLMEPIESNRKIADYVGVSPREWRQMVDIGEVKDERVLAWIGELRKSYKTAMLSNVGRGSMTRRFSEQELQTYFDAVIISGDLGIAKPDVAIYEHAARQLGVEVAECVFLDDREMFSRAAEQAGMQAILYQNLDQAKADFCKLFAK